MKGSSSRILTTHVGSLVRPQEIVAVLQGKEDGRPFAEGERALVARHVAEAVRMQAECEIDIPSDGEYSKTGFSQYITDRLTGFELRTDLPGRGGGTARSRDRQRFADAYREIEGSSQNAPTSTGQPQLQMRHTVCTGPISYRGRATLQADLGAFRAALAGHRFEEAFIPAVAPGTIELQRANHFYPSREAFLNQVRAAADALVEQRYLLAEDVTPVVENSGRRYDEFMRFHA